MPRKAASYQPHNWAVPLAGHNTRAERLPCIIDAIYFMGAVEAIGMRPQASHDPIRERAIDPSWLALLFR